MPDPPIKRLFKGRIFLYLMSISPIIKYCIFKALALRATREQIEGTTVIMCKLGGLHLAIEKACNTIRNIGKIFQFNHNLRYIT